MKVSTDTTVTYSFKIKEKTKPTSEFENFVIEIINNELKYWIYRYERDELGELFPYKVNRLFVNEDQINAGYFNDLLPYVIEVNGSCYEVIDIVSSRDFETNTILIPTGCGGGSSSSSDSSNTGSNTGSDSGDYTGSNDTSEGEGSTGGGSNTSDSSNTGAATGVNAPCDDPHGCDNDYLNIDGESSFEGSDDMNFDQSFWDNANFQNQSLPNFNNFFNAYPKSTSGGKMPSNEVFQLIGGNVNQLSIQNNYGNACAERVSRALNYSGISIPYIPNTTFSGNDGKYYFLSARNLFEWMKKTFGNPNVSLTQSQAGTTGSGFYNIVNGRMGIYIMIPNYPGVNYFGASGHSDMFDGNTFNGNGYFNAKGGVNTVNLWIMN